ncbi:MAG: metallophosphoesterase [Immundisolibacter sp.]
MIATDCAPDVPLPDAWALAHLSDPHLTDPLRSVAADWPLKRRLGRVSWRRRRRHRHRLPVLATLVDDLRARAPEQVALSGDLVQVGLADEFAQAAQWLADFVPPERLLLVPGNHEAYVAGAWQAGRASWQRWLGIPDGEPWLRRHGELLLIGLSSAVPTWPGLATGTLGRRQLALFEDVLAQGAREGLFRVVVVHHPPVAGVVGWRKRLTDRHLFAAAIARHGAGLVLHGHAHRATWTQLAGPSGPVPVVGAPSASAVDPRPGRMAGYSLLSPVRADGAWQVTLGRRVYRPATQDCAWQETRQFASAG